MLSDLRFRMRALFRRREMERELDAELRFHVEREIEKHVAAGHSPAEAERRARLEFGGVERIKDDARDVRGIGWVEALSHDVRYGWRTLRAKPGFTAAVVLTLGLGVGANAAMFGVVDRLLFRAPEHLVSPERVHRVYLTYTYQGREYTNRHLAYRRYLDLTELTASFEAAAAFGYREAAIGIGQDAREHTIAAVTASLFELTDARPVVGRFFTAAEDQPPEGQKVAVLGYGFWQAAFGGRREVVGEQLHVGSAVLTVIGVAPEGFVGITEGPAPAVFVPVTTVAAAINSSYPDTYNWSWLEVVLRRRPGVSEAAASADVNQAYARSWELERRRSGVGRSAAEARTRGAVAPVQLGRGPQAEASGKVVVWVMGVAAIVLLIACANVVNLLLARAVHRRREIALRLALGVTRGRLLRQLVVEMLLLVGLGGAAGLALAQWGGGAVRALFLRAEDVGAVASDTRTLAFTATITLLLALLTALAPAMQALRADVAAALKMGPRDGGYRTSGLRSGLLMLQAALCAILLVGAGLFVKSLANVRSLPLGYDVEPVLYVAGTMRGTRLAEPERAALLERLLEAARSTPGVVGATLTVSVPFWSFERRGAPHVPGVDSVAKLGNFTLQAGSPTYFETTGTRILRGRGFTAQDHATSDPVIVINEAMAQALWPGADPLGKQLRIGSDTLPMRTVVGVAETIRGSALQGAAEFWYYLPVAQFQGVLGSMRPEFFVRVNGSAATYADAVRQRMQRVMPGTAYVTVTPVEELVAPQQRAWQFGATMFVAFGALALVLAAIGLYSVCAYAVAQRTRELGVRIALGASVGAVIALIAREALLFASVGLGVGGAVALFAGRWIEPLLFSASPHDPAVYGIVAAALLSVAVVATIRPALRATRVDPTSALRAD